MMNKKKHNNQGNSFIMVVATLSFLAVLTASILVAVAMCYRMKAYDINSRDNFYYLEQAMDEIYAGVGTDAMEHLSKAYGETIEVIVYYDPAKEAYVTMSNAEANDLVKKTFLQLVKNDPDYQPTTVLNHLTAFMSNPYDATSNPEGVQISIDNLDQSGAESVKVQNLILKREAKYSTVNTRKDGPGKDTFVQSITTDLLISKPEVAINFNMDNVNSDDLYEFVMLADMGAEVSGVATDVTIAGNIYAAADFYNKDYNNEDDTRVNSYNSAQKDKCNGVDESSMYSGFYVNGASSVDIVAEKMIVPGSIAAMNSSVLSIGANNEKDLPTEVWTDGLILGGYSLKAGALSNEVKGSKIELCANVFNSDDLELNAKASEFKLTGQYYGYNYASLDNRSYTDACLENSSLHSAVRGRHYSSKVPKNLAKDGKAVKGQAHYNSSAVIINGADSILDLGGVSSMYIAGQSYIEISKETTKHNQKQKFDDDGNPVTDSKGNAVVEEFQVYNNRTNQLEVTSYNTYAYPEMTTDKDDNYTTTNSDKDSRTDLEDYRTGEALSIKSNQLAYLAQIPNSLIKEDKDGNYYLQVNKKFYDNTFFKKYWNWPGAKEEFAEIPVIKSVVSGKAYYFFDFSKSQDPDKMVHGMNEFIADYAAMFEIDPVTGTSMGEELGLTDITNYDDFKVKDIKLKPDTTSTDEDAYLGASALYSNSAISVLKDNKVTIKSRGNNIVPLVSAANNINRPLDESARYTEKVDAEEQNPQVLASKVTTKLQSQYREMKWMLSTKNRDAVEVSYAQNADEGELTPLNYYFNMKLVPDDEVLLDNSTRVWMSTKDVLTINATAADTKLTGIIICKGDVEFSSNVSEFTGLIVAGGKVIIDHPMDLAASEDTIKDMLDECDASTDPRKKIVCDIFKRFNQKGTPVDPDADKEIEPMKTMTQIQFEDVLSFENWKKNVD